ncbi:MAG TPA: H-NS histone family protein [Burkholderiaceae bacterium]
MTKTYEQLIKQIDTLSREADKLKRKEREGVISRMKEAISIYDITANDLGLTLSRLKGKAAGTRKAGKSKSARAARFRDEAGNVWVGRGPRPQWLRDALAAGKSLADFAV